MEMTFLGLDGTPVDAQRKDVSQMSLYLQGCLPLQLDPFYTRKKFYFKASKIINCLSRKKEICFMNPPAVRPIQSIYNPVINTSAVVHEQLVFFFFFSIFSTIGMLIYSFHTQRDHTAKRLSLSNIGYLAKCSVAWSILIQVALEIHAPIHSLISRSWSKTSKTIFRKKSRNNKMIVLLEWWLDIRVQKSGLFSLPQLDHSSLRVKICSNGSVEFLLS